METDIAPWPVWVFIGIGVGVIGCWLYLVSRFFLYMSRNHPESYKEMGSPTLFMNNSIGNNFSFLNFIISGKHKELNDPELNNQCRFMKVFFYSYVAGFALLLIGVFSLGSS